MKIPAAIASTAMIMGGIVNPLKTAMSPHRISQIASKIIPMLFVSLIVLTSVC
jgi:hypothetical protein